MPRVQAELLRQAILGVIDRGAAEIHHVVDLDPALGPVEDPPGIPTPAHGDLARRQPAVGVVQQHGLGVVHAGGVPCVQRAHVVVIQAQEHVHEIQRVDAQVQQRAAALFRVGHAVQVRDVADHVDVRQYDAPDAPCGDGAFDETARGQEARPERLAEEKPPAPEALDHLARLTGVHGKGLFAQHGLAGGEAFHRVRVVKRVQKADVDHVHRRVFDHRLVAVAHLLVTVFPRQPFGVFPVARGDAIQLDFLHGFERAGDSAGDVAAPQHADSECGHNDFLLKSDKQ